MTINLLQRNCSPNWKPIEENRSYTNALEFAADQIPTFGSLLTLKDRAAVARVNSKMPPASQLLLEPYLYDLAHLFVASPKELLQLVKTGGLPLLIQILNRYFDRIEGQNSKEEVLTAHFLSAVKNDNTALAYALLIFAKQNSLQMELVVTDPDDLTVDSNHEQFTLRLILNAIHPEITGPFVDGMIINIYYALLGGAIELAEKKLAFVLMMEKEKLHSVDWKKSWESVAKAFQSLAYEKIAKMEQARMFIVEHLLEKVDYKRSITDGFAQVLSWERPKNGRADRILKYIREKGILTEEQITEVVQRTTIHWLQINTAWRRTQHIAQRVFDFAKKKKIALPNLGELIGKKMWSLSHHGQFAKFIKENGIEVPNYWQNAAIGVLPGLGWLLGAPKDNPTWDYPDELI